MYKLFARPYRSRSNDHDSEKEEIEASLDGEEEQINSNTKSYNFFPRAATAMGMRPKYISGWLTENLLTLD